MLQSESMEGSFHILVVLDQFRECADRHWEALGEIDKTVGKHLVAAEGFYDPLSDSGVLLLQFSLLSALNLDLDEYIARTGLPTIVPSLMDEDDRDALYVEYLSQYCVYARRLARDDTARSPLVRTLMAMAAGGVEARRDYPANDTPDEARAHA